MTSSKCSVALPLNQPGKILPPTLPTPSEPNPGGSFTLACSTTIAATPLACISIVLDTATYPKWNRFIPRVTITAQPDPVPSVSPDLPAGPAYLTLGTAMTFDVHLDLDSKKSRSEAIKVSVLEPLADGKGWRVAWIPLGMPGFVHRTERVQEFVDDGNGGTEYYCWETFHGLLAPVTRMIVGAKLEKAFDAWMNGLKNVAEGKLGQ